MKTKEEILKMNKEQIKNYKKDSDFVSKNKNVNCVSCNSCNSCNSCFYWFL